MSDMKLPFDLGIRVTLVQRKDGVGFGIAREDKRVVALPDGYDGYTGLFYLDGWIGVFHPELPSLSLNPLTDQFNLMTEEMERDFRRCYQPPVLTH